MLNLFQPCSLDFWVFIPRVTSCPSLPRTVMVLALKVLHPEKPLSLGKTPQSKGVWLITLFSFPEPIAAAAWEKGKCVLTAAVYCLLSVVHMINSPQPRHSTTTRMQFQGGRMLVHLKCAQILLFR